MDRRETGINRTGAGTRLDSIEPNGPSSNRGPEQFREQLEQQLSYLKAIPRNIATNANLSVFLGDPSQGSYCQYGGPSSVRIDRVTRSITIDPQHLLEENVKFIVAHEGMHAYVTASAFDYSVNIALKKACDPEALYREVGFASILNYLEDCGGNSWLTKHYPAFAEPAQALYDSMLRDENPQMHSGETKAVMQRLGFFPRFAQFGSEIMKRWHTGSYSTTLDPAVSKALNDQQPNADRFIQSFPDGKLSDPQDRDAHFCRRFLIAAKKIMPAVRELVALDKAQAAMQQFLNEQARNSPSQNQSGQQQQGGQQQGSQSGQQQQQGGQQQGSQSGQQQQQGGQQQGSQSGQQQQQGGPQRGNQPQQGAQGNAAQPSGSSSSSTRQGGGSQGSQTSMGGQVSPETAREVADKTAAHREQLRADLQKQLDKLSRHLGGAGAGNQNNTENQTNDSPTAAEQAKQIEELQKRIEERFDQPQAEDAKKQVEKHLENLKKLHESIDSQAAPIESLSQQAQQELQDLFDQQNAQDIQRWEQAGEELLKELEDAIRETLESQLQQEPPPNHRQMREAKEDAEHAQRAYQKAQEDAERLEQQRRSQLSLWDAAREDVSGLIGTLYSRLEHVLRPTVPEWDTGHATGNRINTGGAMQAKADPQLATKMWEQRSLPIEREFVFSLLVDNSGSMSSGSEKYLHARRCAVLLSEVLTRLKIPFEITIFSNGSEGLRSFSEKPDKAKKNEIAAAIDGNGGGTQDYDAIRERVTSLASRSEENKFLIVITDGESTNPTELESALAEGLQKGIRVVGLGVGSDTTDVDKYYPIGRGGLTLDAKDKKSALGPYFAKVLEGILKNPQQFVAKALREKGKDN
jgi:hypothetical protein